MGIPYADHIMNAVVLTAVLSCLNSGLYTASRMLFVLAARREAPVALITVNTRGVPGLAILTSTVVGFLCVIAAAVSPDTVFLVPAELLRRHHPVRLPADRDLAARPAAADARRRSCKVKMWLFPFLTIAHHRGHRRRAGADVLRGGHPVPAAAEPAGAGPSCWCSTCVTQWRGGSVGRGVRRRRAAGRPRTGCWCWPTRPSARDELLDELRAHRRGAATPSTSCACRPTRSTPARPSTRRGLGLGGDREAAQARLDRRWQILRGEGLHADGELGDHRPMHALQAAVSEFQPDRIVISTHPEVHSAWLRHDVVDKARQQYDIPVRHIVATAPAAMQA